MVIHIQYEHYTQLQQKVQAKKGGENSHAVTFKVMRGRAGGRKEGYRRTRGSGLGEFKFGPRLSTQLR